MKSTFVLASVLASMAAGRQPSFREWKRMFHIRTSHSKSADRAMEKKYQDNVDKIDGLNAEHNGATFAVNQFAAMDQNEWRAFLKRSSSRDTRNSSVPVLSVHEHDGSELVASVDWVNAGAVTGVKDQGQCEGCWSFAATGGLEGAHQIASGQLGSLSEQQFLDCDSTSNGCNGGLEYRGWNHFKSSSQGICTGSSYPYKGENSQCDPSSCTIGLPAGSISGVTYVQRGSTDSLKSALNLGPVAVGIKAAEPAFQFYSGGVLTGTCGRDTLDHSVLAVGYDTDGAFWNVKNSWGTSWGEGGFVRMSMDGNKCGILDDPSFPVLSASVAV